MAKIISWFTALAFVTIMSVFLEEKVDINTTILVVLLYDYFLRTY